MQKVFAALHDGVKVDVSERNALGGTFEVVVSDAAAFVVRRTNVLKPVVQFSFDASYISIDEDRFTVGINDEGRCVLKDDEDKEYEQWQVRKLALEKLFFPKS